MRNMKDARSDAASGYSVFSGEKIDGDFDAEQSLRRGGMWLQFILL